MSLLGSIGSHLKGAVGGFVAGGIPGAIAGGIFGGGSAKPVQTLPSIRTGGLPPLPGGGMRTAAGGKGGGIGGFTGATLGALGAAGRGVAGIARGAASMCAKYPAWCVAVGGVAAVANLMHSGQLPVPRRRRRRGITPKDLQSFRRVANLVKHYSGPVRHMRTTTRGRGKSCR